MQWRGTTGSTAQDLRAPPRGAKFHGTDATGFRPSIRGGVYAMPALHSSVRATHGERIFGRNVVSRKRARAVQRVREIRSQNAAATNVTIQATTHRRLRITPSAVAIHHFSSRPRLRTMVTLHVSLPRRGIRLRAVLRAAPASFKRRRPTSGLKRGCQVVLYGRSARERAPERNCPCRSRSSAG